MPAESLEAAAGEGPGIDQRCELAVERVSIMRISEIHRLLSTNFTIMKVRLGAGQAAAEQRPVVGMVERVSAKSTHLNAA